MRAISTERLDLLPLRVEHAEEMATVLSDPALHAFIGGEPDTPAALRSRYERMVAGSPDPAVIWLNWVIRLRAERRLTGTVQATVSGKIAEIAWVVGTRWQDGEIRWQRITSGGGGRVDRRPGSTGGFPPSGSDRT